MGQFEVQWGKTLFICRMRYVGTMKKGTVLPLRLPSKQKFVNFGYFFFEKFINSKEYFSFLFFFLTIIRQKNLKKNKYSKHLTNAKKRVIII